MSTFFNVGTSWPGYAGIKKIFVFGDSYSYNGYHTQSPVPSASQPMGVPFPGAPNNEPGRPNWIGHLIRSFGHGQANMLVYDYAIRGDTIQGVRGQIASSFVPVIGKKPSWAPWRASDSLFVTWIGVNDCRLMLEPKPADIDAIVANLFLAQEQLYVTGARNFLFIDLPPIHRSPAGSNAVGNYGARFWGFNEAIKRKIQEFAANHPDATLVLYSSWAAFTRVLDNPAAYGFSAADVAVQGGSIWFDHIHPTSKMHQLLAREIVQLLSSR
ncbi:SGNH hydrolase-type esterase domain-containing protein [Vararia minispora EC-137]|uniref:SGNH hydrolase-type esterase domain-containing protein n=1 Tax=Vararia minispora EC-137 TaxID=1314806 RepID=A0ACB8QNT7_9AGAM|nr:SGNH hydrolase-type esterase domain-containing protein [Vararia minispora EC-137]